MALPAFTVLKRCRVVNRTFAWLDSYPKRIFEKSWQIKTHGTRTSVRPSCWRLECGNIVGEMTKSGLSNF